MDLDKIITRITFLADAVDGILKTISEEQFLTEKSVYGDNLAFIDILDKEELYDSDGEVRWRKELF